MILRDSFLTRRKEMPTIMLYSINKLQGESCKIGVGMGEGMSGDWMEANMTCTVQAEPQNIVYTI